MSRGRSHFRQSDLTRAIKAAQAAGLEIARIEIDPNGTIKIVPGKPESEQTENPWDEVLKAKSEMPIL